MNTVAEIRQSFLNFFSERDHRVVKSSPLVPGNDPTLLFTNAGMVQFKDVFLGSESRDYRRAVSSQRCVRAGGKHNDLENVGYTARHHTFFEMLGNFSFGDYFKQDAIQYAWVFLTEVCGLPPEKLWVTVYEQDDEAARIWLETIGVDPARLSRIGDKPGKQYESDNFWAMGDTGPCGPCTEIFYDHGADVPGGPPGTAEEDGDRYVEIWNLVFMQFDRTADGSMKPLPSPCVDTGMGLERLAAVLQGVHSNYDIDLFQHLLQAAARCTGIDDLKHPSLKVIADHIRACAFLIADGVLPSNEGRGYVLRRIIRRAIRHGYKLGRSEPFFAAMVDPLIESMGEAYPILERRRESIVDALSREERRFGETLEQGMKLLEQVIAELDRPRIPGDVAFKLYDTYGFPIDLTRDIARERELQVDEDGFEQAMQVQRKQARAGGKFAVQDDISAELLADLPDNRFIGYDAEEVQQATVIAILVNGTAVDSISSGQDALVLLDRTPFYAESGGQVGDTGRLTADGIEFQVQDTRKVAGVYHGHQGTLIDGQLRVGDQVDGCIDHQRRLDTVRHHSATHLMHAALRSLLGEHVEQKGSLVAPDRLRFDFTHFEPLNAEQIRQIETLVNEQIQANAASSASEMAFDDAIEAGALAFFGDKYGDRVRVLQFGDYSTELCGGTHVDRVGDIGLFKIISESGISAGVRRIEAVAGRQAVQWVQQIDQTLKEAAGQLKASPEQLSERVESLLDRSRSLEKELDRLKNKLASAQGADLTDAVEKVGDIAVISQRLDGVDPNNLRGTVDQLKAKLGSAIIVLATVSQGRVRLVAGVTKDLSAQFRAGELVNHVASQVGGKGGGRPDFAQAGGTEPDLLPDALNSVTSWVRDTIK